jgi:uncharacterized protein (DUF608 family)
MPKTFQFNRRDLLKMAGGLAVGSLSGKGLTAFAGPFTYTGLEDHLIPEDKKLSPEWVKSLFERGLPEWYSGDQLPHIGMPVGGICCGQLYLGGDGRLWLWDIFASEYSSNYGTMSMGVHYEHPPLPQSVVDQGFALKVGERVWPLASGGFEDIQFRGEYPIGRVKYSDPDCPLDAELEAFSPFIPLDHDSSGLPMTVMNWTLKNSSTITVEADFAGWLENAVCPDSADPLTGVRINRVLNRGGRSTLYCSAGEGQDRPKKRRSITFEDFESDDYDEWVVEGTAFGDKPFRTSELADYHSVTGQQGKGFVNSHNTRVEGDTAAGDAHVGTLTSKPFPILRRYISFRIGGGKHPGETCINLVIDGVVVKTATGHDGNAMRRDYFNVAEFEGQEAQIQIVDAVAGPWGNIGVDHIVFTDDPDLPKLNELPGYGSMALTVLGEHEEVYKALDIGDSDSGKAAFLAFRNEKLRQAEAPFDRRPTGALGVPIKLAPGEEVQISFLVSWWFPYYPEVTGEFSSIEDIDKLNRHYEGRFSNASSVAAYGAENFDQLSTDTQLWNRTWYDSTLPHWLLDRSFISIDCLATQTCHWFDNDRFYGWEGVTCCPGTCQHVWNYAQGLARIFPDLERRTREKIDYGISFQKNGELWYRGEAAKHIAHDGQLGTILRAYREHTISDDKDFLRSIWRKVKKSIQHVIEQDKDGDGLLEGQQYNTLDQAWNGPMGWISSMYLAAVMAGREMALEMGDKKFAEECDDIVRTGRRSIVEKTFDGEMFIHHPTDFVQTNTNKGCHIDQVFGQSFAWQAGLPRVVPQIETKTALKSLYKYNFAPDAGGYRNLMQDTIKGGRWYAMTGEAGLLMTTWPKGGADKAKGSGKVFEVGVGYFNECMNGFEYQAASHMVYEGEPGSELVEMGLAITKAVHDRYSADKRNPYNEVECSDHYSRSMAAYGIFLACCGFSYHGPKRKIGFAPRLTPEDFRAPFTAAEGWGTYTQKQGATSMKAECEVRSGELKIKEMSLELPGRRKVLSVALTVNGDSKNADYTQDGKAVTIEFDSTAEVKAGETLQVDLTYAP